MTTPIRVVVIDDHAVVREGIRTILARGSEFSVVGEGETGEAAISLAATTHPDVLLLDVALPDLSGLAVTETLRARGDQTPILILSVYDNPEYILQAVNAGANGYVLKDSSPRQLREAILSVHRGEPYFSSTVTQQLALGVETKRREARDADVLRSLTPREEQVLKLIARGLTNKATAKELGIGPRTVETHRKNVMQKLELATTAELVRFALKHEMLKS